MPRTTRKNRYTFSIQFPHRPSDPPRLRISFPPSLLGKAQSESCWQASICSLAASFADDGGSGRKRSIASVRLSVRTFEMNHDPPARTGALGKGAWRSRYLLLLYNCNGTSAVRGRYSTFYCFQVNLLVSILASVANSHHSFRQQ